MINTASKKVVLLTINVVNRVGSFVIHQAVLSKLHVGPALVPHDHV